MSNADKEQLRSEQSRCEQKIIDFNDFLNIQAGENGEFAKNFYQRNEQDQQDFIGNPA